MDLDKLFNVAFAVVNDFNGKKTKTNDSECSRCKLFYEHDKCRISFNKEENNYGIQIDVIYGSLSDDFEPYLFLWQEADGSIRLVAKYRFYENPMSPYENRKAPTQRKFQT